MAQQVYTFSKFLENLKDAYGGRPLPIDLSDYLTTRLYPSLIPHGFKREGDPECDIYTHMGLKIATGYQAIAFTDYGPFLEITKEQLVRSAMQQSSGTSNRAEDNMSAYIMYRSNDGMAMIRLQIREIMGRAYSTDTNIRHYRRNRFYVSVYEVTNGILMESEEGNFFPEDNTIVCQPVNCFGNFHDNSLKELLEKWPAIKENYLSLCSTSDPLSLLGSYQLVEVEQGSAIKGVANLFCDMTNIVGRRRVGMNYDALVNCIYKLCCDYPESTILIPYYIGCSTNAEWNHLHLKLSCRLKGKNVRLVRQKRLTRTEGEPSANSKSPTVLEESSPAESVSSVSTPLNPDSVNEQNCEDRKGEILDADCRAIYLDAFSPEKRKVFLDLFECVKDLDDIKLKALIELLR